MGTKTPYLDGPIQRRGGKRIAVLRVELDLHDIVSMSFKDLGALESSIPVPELDRHVIGGGQDIRQGRVNFQRPNVISVRIEFLNFFHGIVVEYTYAHVITRCEEPLLANDKFGTSDRQFTDFKRLDHASSFVIPNHDITRVQSGQDPWFCRVNVNALDALARGAELFLNVKSERLQEERPSKVSKTPIGIGINSSRNQCNAASVHFQPMYDHPTYYVSTCHKLNETLTMVDNVTLNPSVLGR